MPDVDPATTRPAQSEAGFRDLLLALASYPDRAPDTAMRNAAAVAERLGGAVTALALHVRIDAPSNRLADFLLDFKDLVRSEEARSAANARALAAAFEAAAKDRGVPVELRSEAVELYGEADRFAQAARTHDLTLVPMGPAVLNDRAIAEAVLFGSGRPVMLLPESRPLPDSRPLHTAVIAWDASRPAARALADALPVLRSAGRVRVLTIVNEKPSARAGAGADVVRHLALHGVSAAVDEVDARGESIGAVLRAYLPANSVDLLVMGAFGRSRAREFVLGGATRAVLEDVTVPVLLSH